MDLGEEIGGEGEEPSSSMQPRKTPNKGKQEFRN